MMARLLYTLLIYLATPLILLRLLWRARRQPEYLQHLGERWGVYRTPAPERLIWVHAVSVGETRAAQPLIEALQAAWPEHRILLTAMTPTGRATGREVYGDGVIQAYLPYDYPAAVDRFIGHFSPSFGVLMETEIWPNLLAGAQGRRIPVILANARLSERSARGYGRLPALARPAFGALHAVAAQTAGDAERIAALGAARVSVCGNIKFDVSPAPEKIALGQAWREAIGQRRIWLAASTREGEEEHVLAAWRSVAVVGGLLVLVPRHPQRFDQVAELLAREGVAFVRRSTGLPQHDTAVWLGDSMGEMVAYYTLAEVAFIGGSLMPLGGQNLIEAAACGCPVVVGPHTFNFQQATVDAIAAGAAARVEDAEGLATTINRLFGAHDELERMRLTAASFAAAHRGATVRTVELIRASLRA
ncbi:MAG: lipid IV(A) 3-deoxy-D-manno-octulosonic acid transferase [Dechloromonas sp.]|nr:MAG: lipid IV(A) 3-deoxy-D-manno-octulosonic acid transferase [Dechloromonas sp.]